MSCQREGEEEREISEDAILLVLKRQEGANQLRNAGVTEKLEKKNGFPPKASKRNIALPNPEDF